MYNWQRGNGASQSTKAEEGIPTSIEFQNKELINSNNSALNFGRFKRATKAEEKLPTANFRLPTSSNLSSLLSLQFQECCDN